MNAIVTAIGSLARFFVTGKVKLFAFFAYISSNFLTFFLAIQVLVWIGSAIFTLMLAFYGTEMILSFLDITGIKQYIGNLLDEIFEFGSDIDVANNAFGTDIQTALHYFRIFDFLNLMVSLWFGIFSLKLNIIVWRATRFNTTKTGLLSSLQK